MLGKICGLACVGLIMLAVVYWLQYPKIDENQKLFVYEYTKTSDKPIQPNNSKTQQPSQNELTTTQKPPIKTTKQYTKLVYELPDTRQLELQVHNEINQIRQSHGLSTLKYSEQLAEVARRHSLDMALRGYFSHFSPEGSSPFERVNIGAGDVCMYDSAGENLALRSSDFMPTILVSLVDGWMSSSGHRANILYPTHTTSGVGIVIGKDWSVYATHNFCQEKISVNDFDWR